jgi:diaminopimelate decarboxylase
LKTAIEAGVVMNLDNEHEAELVDNLLKNECKNFQSASIGLRINPVVATATKLSKFGVPLTVETKDKVIKIYKDYSWLNGIHFHVGSQGVPIELFVDGAKVIKKLLLYSRGEKWQFGACKQTSIIGVFDTLLHLFSNKSKINLINYSLIH